MRVKLIITGVMIAAAALLIIACGGGAAVEKTIKSTTAGELTVTLASATGELKNGENELMLSFANSSGQLVDVGAASLRFHMPAMASMAEMNSAATLTTTDTPGKYRAQVNIEMAGTWEAIVKYEGPQGTGQGSVTVIAR